MYIYNWSTLNKLIIIIIIMERGNFQTLKDVFLISPLRQQIYAIFARTCRLKRIDYGKIKM